MAHDTRNIDVLILELGQATRALSVEVVREPTIEAIEDIAAYLVAATRLNADAMHDLMENAPIGPEAMRAAATADPQIAASAYGYLVFMNEVEPDPAWFQSALSQVFGGYKLASTAKDPVSGVIVHINELVRDDRWRALLHGNGSNLRSTSTQAFEQVRERLRRRFPDEVPNIKFAENLSRKDIDAVYRLQQRLVSELRATVVTPVGVDLRREPLHAVHVARGLPAQNLQELRERVTASQAAVVQAVRLATDDEALGFGDPPDADAVQRAYDSLDSDALTRADAHLPLPEVSREDLSLRGDARPM